MENGSPYREVEWMSEFSKYTAGEDRRQYCLSELVRIGMLGSPLLTESLLLQNESARWMCLGILGCHDGQGRPAGFALPLFDFYPVRFALSLLPEAVQSNTVRWRDGNGSLIPQELRGNTLLCKVGTKGGLFVPAAGQEAVWGGDSVRKAYVDLRAGKRSRDPNVHVPITTTPKEFNSHYAEVILRRFGWGIPNRRYPRNGEIRSLTQRPDGAVEIHPVDDWCVVESPQEWAAAKPSSLTLESQPVVEQSKKKKE